jgi:hypothetical protein
MKRLLLFLLAAGIAFALYKRQSVSVTTEGSPAGNPVERARAAAGASDARTSAGDAVSAVSENMTPDQVRALLGPPDDVQSETLENGSTRETWSYRNVGKTVIFENGVAVSVR